VLTVQAERVGPPAIWRGPVEQEDRTRSGSMLPCLFVGIVLTVFAALVAIGLYQAVIWLIRL
jgi:hypothetical protein